ncbi:helix-turn-helix domain-containing protein [Tunicatimonas pelagia]|uniref:helix-turn-helix domain-containing protein n=1 Tax=Tunicatimonas pelagia TaxID=931531 RepID=UPI002665C94A|nr:helix-turn-helix domain-containing protein [Tunicatimonas pelagia]WKN45511.1 AraC family transcriptional regulator [Tunicatimonas pelagia]
MGVLITFINIAIFQGVVLATIILVSPLFKSKANKYLAYAVFSLSALLLVLVFDSTGLYKTIPTLQLLQSISLEVIFPVFIFLFIAHQVKHSIILSKRRFLLFCPFLYIASLNITTDLTILDNFDVLPYYVKLTVQILWIIEVIIAVVFIPLVLISAFLLIKKSENVQEKKWLTYLWASVFFIFSVFSVTILLAVFMRFDIMPTMRVLGLLSAVLIHWIVFTGIYKFKLADDQKEIKALIKNKKEQRINIPNHVPEESEVNNVKGEFLSEDNIYFKKLVRLCESDQIYRDPSLDREKVAEMLGISSGYVSQLVNSITKDNFINYINRYRVEDVKTLIVDKEFDNYSLLAIGLECGFSSKTTFYNSFKKITGMTPNAYRKTQKTSSNL